MDVTESGELVRTELIKKTHLSIVTMLWITEFGLWKLSGQGKSFSTPSLLSPQRIQGKFKIGVREKLQRRQRRILSREPAVLHSSPGFEGHTDSTGNETKQTIYS